MAKKQKVLKTLPYAIKDVVNLYGKKIIGDVRLVNIISDTVSLDETPAVNNTLRVILRAGYGEKMLTVDQNGDNHDIKIKTFAQELSSSYGLKEVLTQYIFFSIGYGIGWYTDVPCLKRTPIPQAPPAEKREVIIPSDNSSQKNNIRKYALIALAIPLVIGGGYGALYMSAADDREHFETCIHDGDTYLTNSEYANAFSSYATAYRDYNALNESTYKTNALHKMNSLADHLIKEGGNTNLRIASQSLQSELLLDLNDKEKAAVREKLDDLQKVIDEKVKNGQLSLITIISANNGRLNENGKKVLEDLLELSPDDYWLNFIKKKSYE